MYTSYNNIKFILFQVGKVPIFSDAVRGHIEFWEKNGENRLWIIDFSEKRGCQIGAIRTKKLDNNTGN